MANDMGRGDFLKKVGAASAALTAAAASLGSLTAKTASADMGGELPTTVVLPQDANFDTLATFELATEGLTADSAYLYTGGRGSSQNPIWRVDPNTGEVVVVGHMPLNSGNTVGMAFNHAGELFVAAGSNIYKLVPDAGSPPTATLFASGMPLANGLAFDKIGNLWVSDGLNRKGMVYKVSPSGGAGVVQVQIPATAPTGIAFANGIAFNHRGDLLVADSMGGVIWSVGMDEYGNPCSSPEIFAKSTALKNVDGIALDAIETVWCSANRWNKIMAVTKDGQINMVFQNPPVTDPATGAVIRSAGPLEFPTSPCILGKRFYTSNMDNNAGYNSPNTAGELNSTTPPLKGKISVMTVELSVPGMRLPPEKD